MAHILTRDEVARHNTEASLWCIIDSKVYDLTDFLDAHPGGIHVLRQIAGADCTTEFYNLHRHEVIQKYQSLYIGTVDGETSQVIEPKPGDLSLVPYAEPTWLTPVYSSPYYNKSHRRLQRAMREFVDRYIYPEAQESEATGARVSEGVIRRMSESGILHMRLGPGDHLKGVTLLGGVVKPEEFDYFHDLIVGQELMRAASRAYQDSNLVGMAIGMPAVLNFAKEGELKERIKSDIFSGRKKLCLAVTEPFAGSDVSGLRTIATLSNDGQHYIVSGTKKWITNGTFSDYFVTAVKVPKGFTVLIIERGEGVETKQIKISCSSAPGTALVTFTDVKVPIENRLGEEGEGMRIILSNFNHERWMVCCCVAKQSRMVTEECMKWSNQRVVFGKQLIQQAVVRQKLGKMIALCEAQQAWLESTTYQMTRMNYAQQAKHLAGPIALLKMFSTRCAHEIADESVQIFGGRGITQTGMGRLIEGFHRTYKIDAIPGGSEEILADLGVRQAFKNMPKSML